MNTKEENLIKAKREVFKRPERLNKIDGIIWKPLDREEMPIQWDILKLELFYWRKKELVFMVFFAVLYI